jgi:release factor glutamine methyltransferase
MADERRWTIREMVQWITDDLKKRGVATCRLDAELIVSHALSLTRVALLIESQRELSESELAAIRELVRRRRACEPMAYLRGFREFYGRPFAVNRDVLIPRPETEHLVEVALASLQGKELSARVLDLCTGSGCVAITLKCERPEWIIDAVDLSPKALAVAKTNALKLGARWNTRWLVGDLFAPLGAPKPRYDLIVANPPYIASKEIESLDADVRAFEPRLALDGGGDGLTIVQKLVQQAPAWLVSGGVLALEIGAGQAPEVGKLLSHEGFIDVQMTKDYAGHERIAYGRWSRAIRTASATR